jgi:molecular chaperone HtpG
MEPKKERIPFHVDINRIIEVLARQIYQSPLALLRENTQNAFDAILMRRRLGHDFEARIDIDVQASRVLIVDNGIGMTRDDLRSHYWKAGSSGKNNPEARAAGVVGTFGIGAMANFGTASELVVATESAITSERTLSRAEREKLSATEDCIDMENQESRGSPGTTVEALIDPTQTVDVAAARNYISEFVRFAPVDVFFNGDLISGQPLEEVVPQPEGGKSRGLDRIDLGNSLTAEVSVAFSRNGEVWVKGERLELAGVAVPGQFVLQEALSAIKTLRSGFGLAGASVSSVFQFGGVFDAQFLTPTAGREALDTDSMQLLQTVISTVDRVAAETLATRSESNGNLHFMTWVANHGRYELCGNLRIRLEPGDRDIKLSDIKRQSHVQPAHLYTGSESSLIKAYATEDSALLVLSARSPRRQCELEYLRRFCVIEQIADQPQILEVRKEKDWSLSESGTAFRITSILETDYFLNAVIAFGKISHNLPLLVEKREKDVRIVLDVDAPSFRMLVDLYEHEFAAFGGMAKDFVRNVIFPQVSQFVPSSTREGAEAFLKTIRRGRDTFEYEQSDLESLAAIWEEYISGAMSMREAASRSVVVTRRNVQVVEPNSARSVQEVLPDVIPNDATLHLETEIETGPLPAIDRRLVSSDAKMLTIGDDEPSLNGYRCFLALTDRVVEEKGDFFFQPHTTSVVWGGQKALFIFQHHSGEFGLYYDLQTQGLISDESGGGAFPSSTIRLRNKIYIPIPDPIRVSFLPLEDERKRFEVRCDLLYTDS